MVVFRAMLAILALKPRWFQERGIIVTFESGTSVSDVTKLGQLLALSPLDGRYADKLAALRDTFSEFALIKARVQIEIHWLRALAAEPSMTEIPRWSVAAEDFLKQILENFTPEEALQVKAFEVETNHDVKAVEYYLKEKLSACAELMSAREFIHFACTSEDINNLAYGLLVKQARDQILVPRLTSIITVLNAFATEHRALPMLARTHGQAATPTTFGKEWANVIYRLQRPIAGLQNTPIKAKCNGAVGNFNAHVIAYPEVDWLSLSQQLVESLGLSWNPLTTQIEPHDALAELLHYLVQINTILIDFCRDCWGYISLGYLTLKTKAHEVGSSTMPHKVNPIDFENAEGNLSLANAVMSFLAQRLPLSRWQRDLVDSTLLRNLGLAFGYAYLAWDSLLKGLSKINPDSQHIRADLMAHPEILAEAIQTVMRRYHLNLPYEHLKMLTRGQRIDLNVLHAFIQAQDLPLIAKKRLLVLTPENYLGLAVELTHKNIA